MDGLYLSARGTVSEGLLTDLEAAKKQAVESGEGVAFDLGGASAEVVGFNYGRYPFRINTEHGVIGITSSDRLPPVRIQPYSEHLHAVTPRASVQWLRG